MYHQPPGAFLPPPASPRPPLSPVAGLGTAATLLVGLAALSGVAVTWSAWHVHGVVRDYVAGAPEITDADLETADLVDAAVTIGCLAAYLVAGIVFIVWLWRARRNAEALRPRASHSRARGWVIGGWFCPVVNLWFPYQVVRDTWRSSDPRTAELQVDLESVPVSRVVGLWWALFLVGNVIDQYIGRVLLRSELTAETLREVAVAETLSAIVWMGAAGLVIPIIRRITAWQTQQRYPVPAASVAY